MSAALILLPGTVPDHEWETVMVNLEEERLVVAPGGPRPASSVLHVSPGEVIDAGTGRARVVDAPSATDLVITPGGPRARASVHLVEEGHLLTHADRQLQLVGPQGEVVARVAVQALRAARVSPAMGSGWITYSGWTNASGTPISSFTTTWTVPRAPRTDSGQTLFLFNGIEPGDFSHILQPVLQWGPSGAGGGSYWSVASWYVGGGNAFHTNLVRVAEGDVLIGVMSLIGQRGAAFDYASEFSGIAGTTLNVTNNPELRWASETLEAYNVSACSDYPATDATPMTRINIRTGASTPHLRWSVHNAVTDCGQKTVVAVDGAVDGEVELDYRGEARWAANDLVTAARAPQAVGDPAGYTWDVDGTEHVVYRGADLHVHELWFNGAWHHNDLTAAAAAPPSGGDPIGYTWDVDRTQHVVSRGLDDHVHELWFNGAWHHNDLTNAARAPLAAGDPAGYTWSVDSTQHNVYRGLDGHIYELWFNGAWHVNDLTRAAGGPPLAGSDPIGYTWDVDATQHVVYRGGGGRIHELWFNGVWNDNDLTAAAGNPGAAVGRPTGYTYAVDKTEHVVYRRADGHIVELYF